MTRIALFLLVLMLAACSSVAERNQDTWAAAQEASRKAQQDRIDQLAQRQQQVLAQGVGCTEDACKIAIAGFAALLGVAADAGGGTPTAVAPPYERDWAQKLGSLSGLAGVLATGWVAVVNSNNNADIQTAQYGFLESVIDNGAEAAAAIAGAGPRIEVGGDYTGGDRSETTTTVGRDQTGGDHQDGSIVGDENRIDSPGPFDNTGNCTAGAGAPGSATTGAGGSGGVGGSCGDGG